MKSVDAEGWARKVSEMPGMSASMPISIATSQGS
jgi:hypothetical protein